MPQPCGIALCLFLLLVLPLGANPFLSPSEGTAAQVPSGPGISGASGQGGPGANFQLGIREELGELFFGADKGARASMVVPVMALAFLYGLLHALGPGHRKAVVFSIFASRRSPWWQPGLAGLLAGALHGLSSLLIILILLVLRAGLTGLTLDTNTASFWLEAAMGLVLATMALVFILLKKLRPHHEHGSVGARGSIWGLIAGTSLVPCPGASMLLLLALQLDLLGLGVIGVISMSLGMGVVTAGAGYLAWTGRTVLFHRLRSKAALSTLLADSAEYLAYIFLLGMGILSLIPALRSLGLFH